MSWFDVLMPASLTAHGARTQGAAGAQPSVAASLIWVKFEPITHADL